MASRLAYPMTLIRERYVGKDERRRDRVREYNADVEKVERYVNQRLSEAGDDTLQFIYGYIAIDLRMDEERVADILAASGGGNTGMTCRTRRGVERGESEEPSP